MTLNQLEYFCAVCRYHSITRAANELYVTQPTISVAIRDLEKEFHIRLFHHSKNRISLTHDGEAFYRKAEELLSNARSMYMDFSKGQKLQRTLKIGIPPMLGTIFFPGLLSEFQKASDIPITLHECGSVKACELVDAGELDAAIGNLDFYNIDRYHYHIMMEDKYVYCVSESHPLAGKSSVSFDMLKNEKLILFRTDSVQNRTINARFSSLGISPNIILYSSQLRTIENFIKEIDAGAFLYSSIPIRSREIVSLPVEPAITSNIGLVWKKDGGKDTYTDNSVRDFVEFVKKYKK